MDRYITDWKRHYQKNKRNRGLGSMMLDPDRSEIIKKYTPSQKLANRLEGICRDRKKRSLLLLVN